MLTAQNIIDLNGMNEAARLSALGTLLAGLEAGTTGNLREINQTVLFSEFTDGGGASGTFTLTEGTLPVGATVLASAITDVVGFTGNVSAVMIIGDGTDTDRYMTGTANVFKPGHRIRIDITSSNFPQFDRNPNTGDPFGSSDRVRVAQQTIHHGGVRLSSIILPTVRPLDDK